MIGFSIRFYYAGTQRHLEYPGASMTFVAYSMPRCGAHRRGKIVTRGWRRVKIVPTLRLPRHMCGTGTLHRAALSQSAPREKKKGPCIVYLQHLVLRAAGTIPAHQQSRSSHVRVSYFVQEARGILAAALL